MKGTGPSAFVLRPPEAILAPQRDVAFNPAIIDFGAETLGCCNNC